MHDITVVAFFLRKLVNQLSLQRGMINMAVARIVWWKLKPGTRDEATGRIDGYMGEIKNQNGYQGFISLLSMSNPDRITVITIWENEQAMAAAEKDLYPKVVDSLSTLLAEAPQVAHQNVHSVDIAKIYA
jgi:heme-degrading monooxygenase HmoA